MQLAQCRTVRFDLQNPDAVVRLGEHVSQARTDIAGELDLPRFTWYPNAPTSTSCGAEDPRPRRRNEVALLEEFEDATAVVVGSPRW